MPTTRKFADFGKNLPYYCMDTIPDGGMCLSVFLVITQKTTGLVLMGKVNPEFAEWEHIGAINRERLLRIADKWMLPASHFIVYESPNDAVKRVLKEQLSMQNLELKGPFVYSEVYDIERANIKNHWDLEFVYTGELEKLPPQNPAWKELGFVDVNALNDKEFARNHQDILANLGIRKVSY
ncbi:hypothetical protein B9Q05_11280 [Candidatus Marsarchaeota G2 archaeon ECH_B_1]|jgi:ADP-ribose pyrophosphatase YjhB (NUDIX family)|uniref:Nudix hydrolase domain-containing protein n=1 Tax=Candidatus Marsarchaeota G2 archaeon ECH_B_1 TaxID=1978159 RepID=A0A2R6BME7_9ARCH|nr:MAG: hypothetical protein B9Q05_11280 [Candidatus Marsarchaeota G2 archaeon ECH_B_1]